MKLFYSNKTQVNKAYIITLLGNEVSERYAQQCADSCDSVGMEWEIWPAFDGIANPIEVPAHSVNSDVVNILKVTNNKLTRGEVACVLSHVSLWCHCAVLDDPIVILEHDAVMVKRFDTMQSYNSLVWLGAVEWINGWGSPQPIPPHGTDGPNYHFMLRAHAYALDPPMAKNLISHVIKHGIHTSADCMMRADLFNITHQGFFAYDKHLPDSPTTILNRLAVGQTRDPNDKLEY